MPLAGARSHAVARLALVPDSFRWERSTISGNSRHGFRRRRPRRVADFAGDLTNGGPFRCHAGADVIAALLSIYAAGCNATRLAPIGFRRE